MRVVVASDEQPVSEQVQKLFLHGGHGIDESHYCTLDVMVERVLQFRPDFVMLAVSPDPQRAFAALREIHELAQTRVLAIGPGDNGPLILQALREGAYQYVDQRQLETEFGGLLRRLRAEPPLVSEYGRVIVVAGAGGGSGASTLAVNIAAGLSHGERSCALIDMKLEAGDLAALLDVKPAYSLADFCRNMSRMDQAMFEQCFTEHSSGVRLLASPPNYIDVKHVTSQGVRKALSMARATFPYVVVDLAHIYGWEQTQALFQSDIVLLSLRLDFVSLRQARRILDYFHDQHIERSRVRVVASRCGGPRQLRPADVREALGIEVSYFVPDDPKAVIQANNQGVPVVIRTPRAKVSRSLLELAASVNGRHKQ